MQSRLYCTWRCFIFLVGSLVFFLWFSNFDLLDDSAELEAVLDGSQEAGGWEILLKHIKTVLASPSGKEPNLVEKVGKGQTGQVENVLKVLNNKKNGFFIEAGAWDGEELSNTLYMETALGWTGLLVEPNSAVYRQLLTKQRNAFSVNCCLSPTRYPQKVKFDTADVFGAIDDGDQSKKELRSQELAGWAQKKEITRAVTTVQCYPLHSLLQAVGNPTVDFFSLDIEGAEMNVLRTIPFNEVNIKVFLIETNKINITEMNQFMSSVGYDSTPVPPYDHMYIKR